MNPKHIQATVGLDAQLVSCSELEIGGVPFSIADVATKTANYLDHPTDTIIAGKVISDSIEAIGIEPIKSSFSQTSQITNMTLTTVQVNGSLATTNTPNTSAVPTLACANLIYVKNDTNTSTIFPGFILLYASSAVQGGMSLFLGKQSGTQGIITFQLLGSSDTNYVSINNNFQIFSTYTNFTASPTLTFLGSNYPLLGYQPTFVVSGGNAPQMNYLTNRTTDLSSMSIQSNRTELCFGFTKWVTESWFYGLQVCDVSSFADASVQAWKYFGYGNTTYDNTNATTNKKSILVPGGLSAQPFFPMFVPQAGITTVHNASGTIRLELMGKTASNEQYWAVSMQGASPLGGWFCNGFIVSPANKTLSYLRIKLYNPFSTTTGITSLAYQLTQF